MGGCATAPPDLLTGFAIGANWRASLIPNNCNSYYFARRSAICLSISAGEINVLPAALAPGLNDHAGDFWLDFIDLYQTRRVLTRASKLLLTVFSETNVPLNASTSFPPAKI